MRRIHEIVGDSSSMITRSSGPTTFALASGVFVAVHSCADHCGCDLGPLWHQGPHFMVDSHRPKSALNEEEQRMAGTWQGLALVDMLDPLCALAIIVGWDKHSDEVHASEPSSEWSRS